MGRPLFRPAAPPAAEIPKPKVTLRRVRAAAARTKALLDAVSSEPFRPLTTLDDVITDPSDPRLAQERAAAAREANRRAKANLIKAGGRRVNVNLSPVAAEALDTLTKRLGGTATAALEHALIETAKRRRA